MRNLKPNWILLPLLIVFIFQVTLSQQTNKDYKLLLKSGAITLDENLSTFINDEGLIGLPKFDDKHYCFSYTPR